MFMRIAPHDNFLSHGQITVATGVATAIPNGGNASTPTNNADRIELDIKNMDASATIYYGKDANVTVNNGWPIAAGQSESLSVDGGVNVFVIQSSGGNVKVAYTEWGK